jgi:hypothetical protein
MQITNVTFCFSCVLGLTATACGDDAATTGAGGAGGADPTAASTTATSVATGSTTTGATTGATTGPGTGGDGAGTPIGCEPGTLEEDLMGQDQAGNPVPVVWLGSGADPATGGLLPDDGTFVASTTYLTLNGTPETQQRFGQLMGPIIGALFGNPDLLAVQLGTSARCGTARTFAVWRSLEGMMTFATSDAHMAAVGAVGEISRGRSVVTHWEGATIDTLDWDEATRRVAAIEGPFY